MKQKGKVLCVCQGGNSRSVALAYLLKYGYDLDAVAIGWEGNSKETVNMLCGWADVIVLMEAYFKEKINTQFHDKVSICDVGPDRYFRGFNDDLLSQCRSFVENEVKIYKDKEVTMYGGQSS